MGGRRKKLTTKARRHGEEEKAGECFDACCGWGKPFEKGCSPNPFPKSFMPAPMSRLRSRHRRALWEKIKGK